MPKRVSKNTQLKNDVKDVVSELPSKESEIQTNLEKDNVMSEKNSIKPESSEVKKLKMVSVKKYIKHLNHLFEVDFDENVSGKAYSLELETKTYRVNKKMFPKKAWKALSNSSDKNHNYGLGWLELLYWGDKQWLWVELSKKLQAANKNGKFDNGARLLEKISNLQVIETPNEKEMIVSFNPVMEIYFA